MKQRFTLGLLLVLVFLGEQSLAQNIGGFWLGVVTPNDSKLAGYQYANYALQIIQTNTTLSGTTQSSSSNAVFTGGTSNLNGTFTGSKMTFYESAVSNNAASASCFYYWRGELTYNPVDESLLGTYENIVTNTCSDAVVGTVELYRIVLKSGDTICRGSTSPLIVTGKGIRWYSSDTKSNLLARGNTYSPTISQTTTFYITQTLQGNESPPIPITINVIDPTLTLTPTNTGCDKNNGSLISKTASSTGWQYNINGGAFQTSPIFTSLKPGSYTVVAKNSSGCQALQTATITTDPGPTISNLISTPPKCATANGQVSIVAAGGKTPLKYSIDYGVTYQTDATFTNLAGGTYTLRVRDENGCEVNRAVSLPAFKPMTVVSSSVTPTSCGQANGQANFTTTGGTKPVQYSVNNQSFQNTSAFTGLKAGAYTLIARDSLGCTISQSVSVAASTGPQLSDVRTTKAECGLTNGTVSFVPLRATDQYSYSLNSQPFQTTGAFANLKPDVYTVSVKDNQNCLLTQSVTVGSDCINSIQLPTAFSPNHDNRNDILTMYFPFGSMQVMRFTVYDRWGSVVYNRTNFALASGESLWDGQLNGQVLPVGIYVYRMDCQFPDGTQTTYRESVSLLK